MKLSLNWLRDFVDVDISPEGLADLLINAGLEVEGIERMGEGLDNVVVARILSMRPHPNADRLTLCSVTTGEATHAIVCGAKNMKEGDHVALALPGANLPNGMKITKSKIRGEISEGMLCSETEMGLARESQGIMILPEGLILGRLVAEELSLRDTVFEINLTPNRSDCLSVMGIAREVSALTGKPLKKSAGPTGSETPDAAGPVSVEIRDSEGCPRYTARVIKGVKVGPSPLWMKRRLEAVGMRPINNLVDVTNYILMETGQPLHVFDLNLLVGQKIVVRKASSGEKITTLDNTERPLNHDDLIIADSERPVALAGVMGGIGSEVTENTVDILLEAACFKPALVRKAAKRHSLHSESSHRFERGTDINGVLEGSNRATELILKLAGGSTKKVDDIYQAPVAPLTVGLRLSKLNGTLGAGLLLAEVSQGLKRLGFSVIEGDGEPMKVTIPTYRVDISREIDLIEEVARFIGYDRIPVTYPRIEARGANEDKNGLLEGRIRGFLSGNGFYEAVTYGFMSPKVLANFLPTGAKPFMVKNPISEEQSAMRTTIVPNLLQAIILNLSHKNEDLRFYETGRVFPVQGKEGEKRVVSGVMTGSRQVRNWNSPFQELDFFDMKGVVEGLLDSFGVRPSFAPAEKPVFLHPGKSAAIAIGGVEAGLMGELHPSLLERLGIDRRILVFEMDISSIAAGAAGISYAQIPKFPPVLRDVAVVVEDEIPSEAVSKAIRSVDPMISEAVLFDIYRGKPIPEGKKSMAYSIRYQATDRTLKEEEISAVHDRVIKNLKERVGGELRE